jgi:hypothetical protein
MLIYRETNWKNKKGFELCKYDLVIDKILASKTRKVQQSKIEKISLVAFLNKEQKKIFVNICRRLKRTDKDFYQNKNLHATLFGFGPLQKNDYERIRNKIEQFCREKQFSRKKRDGKITISFDQVRPGTMYLEDKVPRPLQKMSNGTVIAIGDVVKNEDFWDYSNQLGSFLLNDKNIESILGANFRRKFPTVWCTLGYYDKQKGFNIGNELEYIFKQYYNLKRSDFTFPISEISLVKSKYKNLRYPKIIQKFKL